MEGRYGRAGDGAGEFGACVVTADRAGGVAWAERRGVPITAARGRGSIHPKVRRVRGTITRKSTPDDRHTRRCSSPLPPVVSLAGRGIDLCTQIRHPTAPGTAETTHRPTQGVAGPRADRLRCMLAWPTARFVENASSCPELTETVTSPPRIMCVAPGSRYPRWGDVASVSASPRSASASTCTAVQYSSRLRCSCGVWSSAASPGP